MEPEQKRFFLSLDHNNNFWWMREVRDQRRKAGLVGADGKFQITQTTALYNTSNLRVNELQKQWNHV